MEVPFEEFYDLDHLTLILTEQCNMNCSYCYQRDKRDMGFMTLPIAMKAIDHALSSRKTKKPLHVHFYGGEPLLRFDTIRDLAFLYHGVKFGITTNLSIPLTDNMIKVFKENNFHLLISIDGLPNTNNKTRGNTDVVVSNVMKLIYAGLKDNLEARMTVTPESAKSLYPNFVYLVRKIGFRNVDIIPQTDVEWDYNQCNALLENLNGIHSFILGTRTSVQVKNVTDLLENYQDGNAKKCDLTGNKSCAVNPDGTIYACHRAAYMDRFRTGDVITGTLSNNTDILSYKAKEYDCDHCAASCICSKGCPMEESDMSIDPKKSLCAVTNMIYLSFEYALRMIAMNEYRNRRYDVVNKYISLMTSVDALGCLQNNFKKFKEEYDKCISYLDSIEQKNQTIPSYHQKIKEDLERLFKEMMKNRFK